jgi:hypothetical protein
VPHNHSWRRVIEWRAEGPSHPATVQLSARNDRGPQSGLRFGPLRSAFTGRTLNQGFTDNSGS